MSGTAPGHNDTVSYGGWRVPRLPGLFGLGLAGTIGVVAGVLLVIVAALLGGFKAALVALVMTSVALVPLTLKVGDVNGWQRMARAMAWWNTKSKNQHKYISGSLTALGTSPLPGVGAQIELLEAQTNFGLPFALLHSPSTGHLSFVIGCEPDGASLVDQSQIDQWVANWSGWLANLSHENGLEEVSVTVQTSPDPGHRLAKMIDQDVNPNAPALARQMLEEVKQTYPAGAARVQTWVQLTYLMARTTRRRAKDLLASAAEEIATNAPHLADSLSMAGAGATRLMTSDEIKRVVRVAYDPASDSAVEEAVSKGREDLEWESIGPRAQLERWDSMRHDSGHSISWVMDQAPRGEVFENVLGRLLAPHSMIPFKRVCMLYRVHDASSSAQIADRGVLEATFAGTTKNRTTAQDNANLERAQATASAEARGHAITDFSMIATATVLREEDLEPASAAMMNLSGTAKLRLRPAYASQSTTFLRALPTGVAIGAFSAVPPGLQEAL